MKNKEILQAAKDRNELDFLFKLTQHVALSDSIGEGWGYCDKYERSFFDAEVKSIETNTNDSNYLEYGGLGLYEIYLKHIKEKSKHSENGACGCAFCHNTFFGK